MGRLTRRTVDPASRSASDPASDPLARRVTDPDSDPLTRRAEDPASDPFHGIKASPSGHDAWVHGTIESVTGSQTWRGKGGAFMSGLERGIVFSRDSCYFLLVSPGFFCKTEKGAAIFRTSILPGA